MPFYGTKDGKVLFMSKMIRIFALWFFHNSIRLKVKQERFGMS